MSDAKRDSSFSDRLLQQEESFDQSRYEEHRMQLEAELDRLERRQERVQLFCKISLVLAFLLAFVGGSELVGGFDPWSKNATALSITLGVVYVVAAIAAVMLGAHYFSSLRPRTRQVRDELLHQSIQELQQEVRELRRQLHERQSSDKA